MEPDLNQFLSQQLRDIHMPEPIGWWPPAPGWWALALILLGLMTWSILRIRQAWTANRYRKLALREAEAALDAWRMNADRGSYLTRANAILRRSLLHKNPRRAGPGTQGEAWIATLNAHLATPLSENTGAALATAAYQPEPDVEIEQVHRDVCRWITEHRFARTGSGSATHA